MLPTRPRTRRSWRLDVFRLEDRNAPSESLSYLFGPDPLADLAAGTSPATANDAAGPAPASLVSWLPPDATNTPLSEEPAADGPTGGSTAATTDSAPTGKAEADWLETVNIRADSPYVGTAAPPPTPLPQGGAGDGNGGSAPAPAPSAGPTDGGSLPAAPPTGQAAGSGITTAPGTSATPPATDAGTETSDTGSDTASPQTWVCSLSAMPPPVVSSETAAASPLKVTVSGTNVYALDRNGYSPEEWKDIVSSSDHWTNPFRVAVDFTVTVTNTSDAPVSIFAGPMMSYLDLSLSGPGVVTTPVFTGGFEDFSPQGVTFAPGESKSVRVKSLSDVTGTFTSAGTNGVNQYWTEAGDYTLTATLNSTVVSAPLGPWTTASDGVPVEASSDPFPITVTEPPAVDPSSPSPGWVGICGNSLHDPWNGGIQVIDTNWANDPTPAARWATAADLDVSVSGTDTYALDPASLPEINDPTDGIVSLASPGNPPKVQLTVSVRNTSDEPVSIPLGGGSPVTLNLSGPGAVSFHSFWCYDYGGPTRQVIQPGETAMFPITELETGATDRVTSFWTEPGNYTLTATVALAGTDTATSAPFAVTVTPADANPQPVVSVERVAEVGVTIYCYGC